MLILSLAVLLLPSCGAAGSESTGADRSSADAPATDPVESYPGVTALQAGDAIADAMLAASSALYLALLSSSDGHGVSSADGALSLSWSDDADFATGIGSYAIELDEFTVAEHTDFGAQAAGYTLTGSIMLESTDGLRSSLLMDLAASHSDPEQYPVRTIEIELSGYSTESAAPHGYVRVNGTEMTFAEVAGAFTVSASTARHAPTE